VSCRKCANWTHAPRKIETNELVAITDDPEIRDDFCGWLTIPNQFHSGDVYIITPAGHHLNLRSLPALASQRLRQLAEGDRVSIVDGPVEADGYTWWKLRTADGIDGWAVDVAGWYELAETAAALTATPSP